MEILGEIPIIKSERLIIRRPTAADTDAVRNMAKDAAVYQFEPGFLFELKYDEPIGASKYIDSYQVEILGIFPKNEPDLFLGLYEIYNYDAQDGHASIGCRLVRTAWGQGFGTEAMNAVLDYLHTCANVRVVYGEVMVDNKASIHMLKKCGFVSNYVAQSADWDRGEPVQIYTFIRRF